VPNTSNHPASLREAPRPRRGMVMCHELMIQDARKRCLRVPLAVEVVDAVLQGGEVAPVHFAIARLDRKGLGAGAAAADR